MPISQDRLISLISVADAMIEARARLETETETQLSLALDEFYANDGNNNPLASSLLARLQMIATLITESHLPRSSIELLSREREHFRVVRSHNESSRRAMARQRKLRREEGASQP